jgi:hypothetical protein
VVSTQSTTRYKVELFFFFFFFFRLISHKLPRRILKPTALCHDRQPPHVTGAKLSSSNHASITLHVCRPSAQPRIPTLPNPPSTPCQNAIALLITSHTTSTPRQQQPSSTRSQDTRQLSTSAVHKNQQPNQPIRLHSHPTPYMHI